MCIVVVYICWFDFCYFVIFSTITNPDPDDDNGIADEGAEDKEDTSKNPDDNSCDIVSIFRSAGDNIVECVDEDEDCGDELLVYPATFTESSWV